MKKKIVPGILVFIGVVCAVLSVVMLISAIQFLEWGRVILYAVALALNVELAVMNIQRLKPEKTEE